MKLYFARRTRATRPRWLLEELGVPYELVTLDLAKHEHKTPTYLAVHPLGVVPALVDQGTKIIESVAICMHIADRFPEGGVAPPLGSPERAAYYQWMVFAAATLEPTIVRASSKTPDEGARPAFEAAARVLEVTLTGREFLIGDRLTAADIVVGAMVIWAGSLKLLGELPALDAYAKALRARPAFVRAQS